MIYKHSHLSEEDCAKKALHIISHQNPFYIIVSKNFLSSTLENTLKIKKIPFIKRVVQGCTLMEHKLPLLMYQNTLLTQQQIVQFLADLWLGDLRFNQYIQRKQVCLELYKKWNSLISEQSQGINPSQINFIKGIKSKQDYHNFVFSGFVLLSSQMNSTLLQNVYQNYKRNQVNLQNLLVNDILNTIINQTPTSMVDHILRGHFLSLLECNQKIKNMLENQLEQGREYEIHQIKILTQQKMQEKVEYFNFNLNWKKFAIGFGIISGIYYIWGDK